MQISIVRKVIKTVALLTWAIICLAIFMYFPGAISHVQGASLHDLSTLPDKLSRISVITFVGSALLSSLGMAFFGFSCVSLGMQLASTFSLEENIKNMTWSWTGILPTYFLIGNAVYSLIFLTLASLSYLSAAQSAILFGLGLLSGLTQFRKISTSIFRVGASQGTILVVLSVAILSISLFQSSARLSYDASAVYFSNAKLTALRDHVGCYLENTFVVSAFHSVIQYTAVIQISGDQSARMITWLFGVVSIALALALAESIGVSILARRILPTLILTSTAFLDLMGDGKVDLFNSAYCLAAVYWMMKAREARQSRNLYVLSGCFIGFACVLRPHNVFLLGLFALIHLLQQAGKYDLLQIVRRAGWMILGAGGFALYHLLINKVILGSPFAFWNTLTNINPTEGPWDFKPETIWINRLLYPLLVTYKNSGASLGNITPLVIVFLPTLAARNIRKHISSRREPMQLYISTVATLFSWVFLFFTIVEVRYVMFLWIILFIPVAEIIAGVMETKSAFLKSVLTSLIILLMCFILLRSIYISISTYSPLNAENNPQCFDSSLCDHLSPINENADLGERVLMLSVFRYYMRTDLFACSTTADEYNELRDLSFASPESFWREVYSSGYTYVAYEEDFVTRHLGFSDAPFVKPPEWVKLAPIIITSQVPQVGSYKIVHVKNVPVKSDTVCRRDKSGIWRLQSK